MTTLPLAQLVEDMSIYPRHAVDDANVSSLVNALRAGATLPPIVADKRSKRITDGWHRCRAYRRVLGAEAVVDVELIAYRDETHMIQDAIERNAAHGRKLDTIDQIRAIALCRERGVDLQVIAKVLHVPQERVEKLSVRLARVESAGQGEIPGTLQVALKRPAVHLAGSNLTREQAVAHQGAPGTSYLLIAHQLTEGIRTGLLNTADQRLLVALRELWDVIGDMPAIAR